MFSISVHCKFDCRHLCFTLDRHLSELCVVHVYLLYHFLYSLLRWRSHDPSWIEWLWIYKSYNILCVTISSCCALLKILSTVPSLKKQYKVFRPLLLNQTWKITNNLLDVVEDQIVASIWNFFFCVRFLYGWNHSKSRIWGSL